MVSVIHQHELAIGLHMSPHSPSHPSRLSQSLSFGFSVSYSKFPLAICFTYGLTHVFGQQLLVSGLWPKAACLQWLLQQRDMQALSIAFHALLGTLRSLLGPLPKAGLGTGDGHPGTTVVESQSPLSWWQRVRGSNSQDWLFFSTIQRIQAAGEHRPFWKFLWMISAWRFLPLSFRWLPYLLQCGGYKGLGPHGYWPSKIRGQSGAEGNGHGFYLVLCKTRF